MVVDTSAAAIANEPDASRFQNAMLSAASLVMSAVTVLESRIVLHPAGAELKRPGGAATSVPAASGAQ